MPQEARYIVVLDYMVLPLGFRDLRYALAKNGYELASVKNIAPPPTRIMYSGEIARMKETTVVADSESSEIGTVSRSLQEAYTSFNDLAKIVKSELDVDLNKKVKRYFVSAHYRVSTGKLPLKEIPKAENKEVVAKFSEIMNQNLSSFSIRLTPKDASLNQENWLDIAIEPDLLDESKYHIGIVYRNLEKERTELFVRDLESNLLKIIKLIEG
jgi:uncharacterized FlaG/YvyC family protein